MRRDQLLTLNCELLIDNGSGTAAADIERLHDNGWIDAVRDHRQAGKPVEFHKILMIR